MWTTLNENFDPDLKGKYYIGDPSYVAGELEWDKFCDTYFSMGGGGWMAFDDIEFFVGGTAWGDGLYPVKKGGALIKNVGVDAGLISFIPMKLIKKWGMDKKADSFGAVVECEGKMKYDNGLFEVGGVKVDTGGSGDDDEEEE